MNVVILGAGVIGVTTAYFLAKHGCKVTVLDRQSGPGLETSFANAGELSYGMTSPWAAPGVPKKAIGWLLMRHRPLTIWPLISPTMWSWGYQMVRNCNEVSYRLNKGRMVRVSDYSREVLADLTNELDLDFDRRDLGTLQLFRTDKQVKASKVDQEVLSEFGVPFEVLDRDGCVAAEPGLSHTAEKFVGGLRLPNDQTGDCHKFTTALAEEASKLGVRFVYDAAIEDAQIRNGKLVAVNTSQGEFQAERFVCCMGPNSAKWLRSIGIKVPVYPIKGYSITLPVADPDAAPNSTLMDETFKVAITRLGDRIRVAGQAEIIGYNKTLGRHATDAVRHVVKDVFPKGGDHSNVEGWTGLRPMTPDGTPILGSTKYDNLFLNTGHGTLGWTMACGSGRIVADLVAGKTPDVDLEGLEVSRYA